LKHVLSNQTEENDLRFQTDQPKKNKPNDEQDAKEKKKYYKPKKLFVDSRFTIITNKINTEMRYVRNDVSSKYLWWTIYCKRDAM